MHGSPLTPRAAPPRPLLVTDLHCCIRRLRFFHRRIYILIYIYIYIHVYIYIYIYVRRIRCSLVRSVILGLTVYKVNPLLQNLSKDAAAPVCVGS